MQTFTWMTQQSIQPITHNTGAYDIAPNLEITQAEVCASMCMYLCICVYVCVCVCVKRWELGVQKNRRLRREDSVMDM